ncbi:Acyl carrier protein, mitochondrial [Trypanosoma equiperdum]|uniref:Acyl carrier protein n=3 Tax=Trypanozoon TaxID=39700 RepID=Q57WW9_TRYB2|nr:acyl carrier protein, mitochondrial precursor,putative [Trypanosoma brucei gambiense DAL972]XP_843682.1 acyl carrier protein, mitochondrial precursor, putative [Trypanosoma brucei brucei TREU927]6SGA_Fc Chain Fc, mt-SAF32 [Trypanosoma brucei brucei]6SGB_Fc Chain Fc, mt-SAF32 [Trypanosoma brucei brucei]6YXX_ER Chain ER, Acyl carrier protein [Trypanosoma brucei brucei]6YXY_EK Chain EK, mt-ACP [Trypanosoma brucei brucei]6YXY_ER Chain ER, mt-ACP [Trypanosoma brucei brucei]7PUA_Fc Chain Fc, Ac|eukprot:XP_011772003.1 acyl carrier protein, mitochondrial precursor,putative [Trypanosoma brucei gambiense DAL972]
MQRSQLARKFATQVGAYSLLRGRCHAVSTWKVMATQAVTIPMYLPVRFHSEGHAAGEEAGRTGQYLLNKDDVLTRVLEVVKNFEKVDASKVTPQSHFVNDLGLNSLDVVEVVFAIEQEFILDIPDHDAEKIQSITDAVEYISQNPMAK